MNAYKQQERHKTSLRFWHARGERRATIFENNYCETAYANVNLVLAKKEHILQHVGAHEACNKSAPSDSSAPSVENQQYLVAPRCVSWSYDSCHFLSQIWNLGSRRSCV